MNDFMMIYAALAVAWFLRDAVRLAKHMKAVFNETRPDIRGMSAMQADRELKSYQQGVKILGDMDRSGMPRITSAAILSLAATVVGIWVAAIWPVTLIKRIINKIKERG